MKDEYLTIKDFLVLLVRNWLICVITASLCLGGLITFNYSQYKKADNNAVYIETFHIDIETVHNKELEEVVKDVIESKSFLDCFLGNKSYASIENTVKTALYGQSYDENIHQVQLLLVNEKKETLEDIESIMLNQGKVLLEKAYGSPVIVSIQGTEHIVAGRNGNYNLASPYEVYKAIHKVTLEHVLIWAILSLTLGVCIEIIWVLFRKKKGHSQLDVIKSGISTPGK